MSKEPHKGYEIGDVVMVKMKGQLAPIVGTISNFDIDDNAADILVSIADQLTRWVSSDSEYNSHVLCKTQPCNGCKVQDGLFCNKCKGKV
jgi:hypothetical protein